MTPIHETGPGGITSSSSWREAFSRSLPPLRSFARTVGPPLAAGPRSLLHPCRGRSGGSRWSTVGHRRVSTPVKAAHHPSMITWGHNCQQGAHMHWQGPKCAGTVPPPQDFHFNHWLRMLIVCCSMYALYIFSALFRWIKMHVKCYDVTSRDGPGPSMGWIRFDPGYPSSPSVIFQLLVALWALERSRISPFRFLVKCSKRRLHHGRLALLYFPLFAFLSCI